jgi:hypothetical protein
LCYIFQIVILIPTTNTAKLTRAACHGDMIRDLACQNRGGGAFCAVRLKQLFDPASWAFIVFLVDLGMLKVSKKDVVVVVVVVVKVAVLETRLGNCPAACPGPCYVDSACMDVGFGPSNGSE